MPHAEQSRVKSLWISQIFSGPGAGTDPVWSGAHVKSVLLWSAVTMWPAVSGVR